MRVKTWTKSLPYTAWCNNGGIAGRGVLLDYCRWVEAQKLAGYDYMSNHKITAKNLEAVAKAQNLILKQGDILLVRSGFTKGYSQMTDDEKIAWSHQKSTTWIGLETSIHTARWLWDTGFAACGGDQPGWESFPIWQKPEEGGLENLALHEVMLSGWGMPIGKYLILLLSSLSTRKQSFCGTL